MSDEALEDFLILRSLDEPISTAELEAAADASGEALQEMRDEGVDVRWVDSEVMTDEAGDVTGTFCHYRAESEAVLEEHAERAGLPATRIDRRGTPLEGE